MPRGQNNATLSPACSTKNLGTVIAKVLGVKQESRARN
jgi:hypothetical protein